MNCLFYASRKVWKMKNLNQVHDCCLYCSGHEWDSRTSRCRHECWHWSAGVIILIILGLIYLRLWVLFLEIICTFCSKHIYELYSQTKSYAGQKHRKYSSRGSKHRLTRNWMTARIITWRENMMRISPENNLYDNPYSLSGNAYR